MQEWDTLRQCGGHAEEAGGDVVLYRAHWFGEDICSHLRRARVDELQRPIGDLVADEVVANADMLHLAMALRVFRQRNAALVVGQEVRSLVMA